tara:strand:- start:752 stop:1525 length:774 start_codon:yes stop_codon:yes gene_type:complete
MADLNPTIVGRLLNGVTGGASAWSNTMPDVDSNAIAGTDDGHQANTIYLVEGWAFSGFGVTDVRCLVMSFNTSGISSAPSSATLKIYGKDNKIVGDPDSHSSAGVLGLKTTMAATDSIANDDWGRIDLSGAGPTLYTDTLTSWNIVGDDTEYNTFTLNSTALTDMGNNDTFQIAIFNKYFYDYYDSDPPFAYGNNHPDGTNAFGTGAGAYFGSESGTDAYKPVLSYVDSAVPDDTNFANLRVKSGLLSLKSGIITIK